MSRAALIYPHQLFDDHPALEGTSRAVLVEEPLLFTQYAFHRQKLIFHRASMRRYAARLRERGHRVSHVEASELADTGSVADALARRRVRSVRYVDPCDDWLSRRLSAALARHGIGAEVLDDPHFLTPRREVERFAAGRDRLHFTEFYVAQRKRLGLLLDGRGKPLGGKWSFDPENRKKLPRGLRPPAVPPTPEDRHVREAREYVRANFPDAPGSDEGFGYPTGHEEAAAWLERFLDERLANFGDYEDAISSVHGTLFHSVLTPALNAGLLSPGRVLDAALARAGTVPLNSMEGFVRQVAGWREFVRLSYLSLGRRQRTRHFWGHDRPMPAGFYRASTGVEPVDAVVRRVLRTGYCHHIERLMILGNFLLLCEVHADAVYEWFMELFIDAYDWVMVPNVYGMSQHADGGTMTTKPYVSGSAYVRRMSDFPKGPWCDVWDALYWRFVDRHADFFAGNPRTSVVVRSRDRLGPKLREHHRTAERFLAGLHG